MNKLTVGIIYGGRSVEHDISLKSAKNVAANLDQELYNIVTVGISRSGNWYLTKSITSSISEGQPIMLSLDTTTKGFHTGNSFIKIDIVFPVLHGTDGEDGSVQGMLKAVDIPFVGSGVLGSSVAMDKLISKRVLHDAGLPVAKYQAFTRNQRPSISFQDLSQDLGLPFIAKPANLGSSIGVVKIDSEESFRKALIESFKYDNTVLFEEFVVARELECAILGNEDAIASVPGEIIISDSYEFYTFKAKYIDPDAVKLVIPADVTESQKKQIQELSLKAYHAVQCKDLSRVDIFLKNNNEVIINEINTIPGFTDASMYPMLFREAGISYKELLTRLLQMCLERFNLNQHLYTDFNSSL